MGSDACGHTPAGTSASATALAGHPEIRAGESVTSPSEHLEGHVFHRHVPVIALLQALDLDDVH